MDIIMISANVTNKKSSNKQKKKNQNQINFHKSRYDKNCNAKIQIKFWKIKV